MPTSYFKLYKIITITARRADELRKLIAVFDRHESICIFNGVCEYILYILPTYTGFRMNAKEIYRTDRDRINIKYIFAE